MQSCKGHAPGYTPQQQGSLRQVLFAVRQVLSDSFGPLIDSRTGDDLIPWMIQVQPHTEVLHKAEESKKQNESNEIFVETSSETLWRDMQR